MIDFPPRKILHLSFSSAPPADKIAAKANPSRTQDPAPARVANPVTTGNGAPAPKKLKVVDRFALETNVDLSVDLAPEHRAPPPPSRGKAKNAYAKLGQSLVELMSGVPREPTETRSLRLTLAVIELTPELSAGYVCGAIRAYADTIEDAANRAAADELRKAVWNSAATARLIRFKEMLKSALAIVEARRTEADIQESDNA